MDPKLRVRLIPFRLVGAAVAILIWLGVVGPILGAEDAVMTIVLLPIMVFGGLLIGHITGILVLRRS